MKKDKKEKRKNWIYIGSIIGILFICIICIILYKNRTVSIISIDINPSIEIHLDKNNKVIKVIAINKDAIEIIKKIQNPSLEKTIENLYRNLDKSMKDDEIDILISTNGKITNKEVKQKLEKEFNLDKGLHIIEIDKITKDDIALSKKYNISKAKAAYINQILKESKIPIESLINQSISSLNKTNETELYCKEGYQLDGDFCIKEIGREKVVESDVCPEGYIDNNGTCYKSGNIQERENKICPKGSSEYDDKNCIIKTSHDLDIKCGENQLADYENVKCLVETPYADAQEYCRITPETDMLIDHRCHGPKPTINGGCLGSDVIINGYCIDLSSYYEAEYLCPDGALYSQEYGEKHNYKCVKQELIDPIEAKCSKNERRDGNKCVEERIIPKRNEIYCEDGYTLTESDNCINLNDTKEWTRGMICDKEFSKKINNECILYEAISPEKA